MIETGQVNDGCVTKKAEFGYVYKTASS